MARNLRARIPASDTLVVHDVNEEAMRKLVDEAKAAGGNAQAVEITDSPRALAEKAVCFVSVRFFAWFIGLANQRLLLGYHHHQSPRTSPRQTRLSLYPQTRPSTSPRPRAPFH